LIETDGNILIVNTTRQ